MGRVIAVLLMLGGISLVGIVTAFLASWIVERVSQEEAAGKAATAAHIEERRGEIRNLAQKLRRRSGRNGDEMGSANGSDGGALTRVPAPARRAPVERLLDDARCYLQNATQRQPRHYDHIGS